MIGKILLSLTWQDWCKQRSSQGSGKRWKLAATGCSAEIRNPENNDSDDDGDENGDDDVGLDMTLSLYDRAHNSFSPINLAADVCSTK